MAGANGSNARTVVAVIGAGIMGSAMARNLAAAGLDTRVWDRSPAAAAALADAGAVAATSAQDAVRDADVVITMLPTAAAVESVIFDGRRGRRVRRGDRVGADGHDRRRGDPGLRDRLAAARPGVTFVDAPVSGSKGPAEQGQLLILASGPRNRGRRAAPGLRRHRPQDRMAGPGRPGQHRQAGRQRLPVHPHRRRRRDHGARRSPRHRPPAARRRHRGRPAGRPARRRQVAQDGPRRLTRRSSRWNGRSKTSTSRSAPQAASRHRSWPRCLASGTPPWPPATAARTSAPPASPCPPQTRPTSSAATAATADRP